MITVDGDGAELKHTALAHLHTDTSAYLSFDWLTTAECMLTI